MDMLDICVLAAVRTTFWGQCCLGEILSPTAIKLPPPNKFLVTLSSHLSNLCTLSRSWILHLAQMKKSGKKGKDIIICKQQGCINAIEAIEQHMQSIYYHKLYLSLHTIQLPACNTSHVPSYSRDAMRFDCSMGCL
jgi:hypothetical protein